MKDSCRDEEGCAGEFRISKLDELVMRAKDGSVTAAEIEAVASALSDRAEGAEPYRSIYVLGRMECRQYEDLLASFLIYPEDPQVAALAVSMLCVHWGLAVKYRDQLLEFLRGQSWDVDNDVRVAAISASGRYLSENSDCDVLARLIETAESDEFGHMRGFGLEALARALGAGYSDALIPRDQAAKATWSRDIMDRAQSRRLRDQRVRVGLLSECAK